MFSLPFEHRAFLTLMMMWREEERGELGRRNSERRF